VPRDFVAVYGLEVMELLHAADVAEQLGIPVADAGQPWVGRPSAKDPKRLSGAPSRRAALLMPAEYRHGSQQPSEGANAPDTGEPRERVRRTCGSVGTSGIGPVSRDDLASPVPARAPVQLNLPETVSRLTITPQSPP